MVAIEAVLATGAGNAARMLFDSTRPEHTAAIIDGDRTTTYGELIARARAVTAALARRDVAVGDRVALFLPRGPEAAAAFFGVLATGAVAVTVNESLRPRQIERILGHSRATVLVSRATTLARLPRRLSTQASLLDLDHVDGGDGQVESRIGDDPAHIVYTSGSTGMPKGVTISHANLWAGVQSVVEYLGIRSDDRIAGFLPFSFDYGLNQLLCAVATGATLVVERSPIPHRLVQALATNHVSVLGAVPPLWLQLLGVDAFRSRPLPSLRLMTNTGGRLPVSAVRQLRESQPQADLVLMYGLTEAFRSTRLDAAVVDRKPSSIGRAIPGAEILVVDDELRRCGPGQIGELVHRGPTVALGYWNDPEASARVFRPNPLRPDGCPGAERVVFSGDLVYQDEDGDLFFVGRRDTMIKTLGYRVSPDEIADVIYTSGEVAEALVTSEPDDARGSRIVAYVVFRDDGDPDRLQAFVAAELPRHMQPQRIEARPALRRTSSGKFDAAATAAWAHDSR